MLAAARDGRFETALARAKEYHTAARGNQDDGGRP